MKYLISLLVTFLIFFQLQGQSIQNSDSISLIFIGDIMGHDTQIEAAYDSLTGIYCYDDVFQPVSNIIKKADFAIANLEVTLAGEPYKGYPKFSSPDVLAEACRNSGIDVLVTANNHSYDRGTEGLVRTLDVLDDLKIDHTGTFRNLEEKEKQNLLILVQNNIKVGLLNYTYGTNGLSVKPPSVVNLIDTVSMALDINESKSQNLDKLIVFLHWGTEYVSYPNEKQQKIAGFLFRNGVDIVIGSHPHVVQGMEYYHETTNQKEKLIAWSLGNFVSNQRTRKRDGGIMVELQLNKDRNSGKTTISDCGYHLTWVHKPMVNGKHKFSIVSCAQKESDGFNGMWEWSQKKMKIFTDDSRELFKQVNVNIPEIK